MKKKITNEELYKKLEEIEDLIIDKEEKNLRIHDINEWRMYIWEGCSHKEEKIKILEQYQVNEKLFEKTPKHAVFLHCLPAHRGQEVTNEVIIEVYIIIFYNLFDIYQKDIRISFKHRLNSICIFFRKFITNF